VKKSSGEKRISKFPNLFCSETVLSERKRKMEKETAPPRWTPGGKGGNSRTVEGDPTFTEEKKKA